MLYTGLVMDPPVAKTTGPQKKRDKIIGVRLTEDGLKSLDTLARKEGRTRSDMARIVMRLGIEQRQAGR